MGSIIYTREYHPAAPDRREILRYAGVGRPDETTASLLEEAIAEAERCVTYKLCFSEFDISVLGETIELGFARVNSHSLRLNLEGCDRIILFAATLGLGFDRLLSRRAATSPARALLLDAVGSERIESLCNKFCRELEAHCAEEGYLPRPRFSAGYGDLPLELQREVFSTLDCPRKIGLTLNESLIMSPSKSVTAIVGLAKKS